MKWLRNLFGLELSPEEKRMFNTLDHKAAEMAKYGGKLIVSDSGAIRDEFETEEGRTQYYRMILNRAMKQETL